MTPDWVYPYLAVFLRVSGCIMLLPAIGGNFTPVRARIMICLMLTLIIAPVVYEGLQAALNSGRSTFGIMAGEFLFGIVLGALVRLIAYAASFAGGMITSLIGLTNVFSMNIEHNESAPILETFLGLATTALIFSTDTHLLMVVAIRKSYDFYAATQDISAQIFLVEVVDAVRKSATIAMHIAAPFLILTVVANFAVAILNRLVQQVPMYFVMNGPIVLVGFVLMGLVADRALGLVVAALIEELAR